MLGEVSGPEASIALANNEEKISNSSTPFKNEKIQRKARKSNAKNKIELNVEMTEEMKRQEQSLDFGATPYSQKRTPVKSSVQTSKNGGNQSGIGNGLNATQKQQEFINFKRQGQQGVQNSAGQESIEDSRENSSQNDLLDMLEDPKSGTQ